MPSWKASRYTVTTEYTTEFYVAHNLLSEQGIMVEAHAAEDLRKVLKKPDQHQDHPLFPMLAEKGMILPVETDEDVLIQAKKGTLLAKNEGVLSLSVIPTYQCNFKCVYCWEDTKDKDDSMKPEAQQRLLNYIDSRLEGFSALNISWFGGEPLMAFPVVENLSKQIDAICKKHRVPYFCSITTNGYLLTLERFNFLLQHNTRFFQVTLDGPATLHDKNRPLKKHEREPRKLLPVLGQNTGSPSATCSPHSADEGGTFDRVLGNLRAIRDNARGNFRFLIRLNVTKETKEYANEFLRLVETEFGHDKRFKLYMQAVEGHDGVREEEMGDNYISVHDKLLEGLFEESIARGIMTSTLRFSKPGDLMCSTRHENAYFVNSDGRFYKCDMEMQRDHATYAGELTEDGTLLAEKEKLSAWDAIEPPSYCNKCVLQPMCFGLKCPYYNSIKADTRCELYNSYSFARCAVKTYAQEGKYEVVRLPAPALSVAQVAATAPLALDSE